MCVGLAAKVVSVKDGTAVIDASGAKRDVSAELLEDLEPGDYVMVHAGVAIAKITSDDETESEGVMSGLDTLLDQIASTETGFRHTSDTDSCKYCDFKNICGR